MSQLPKITDPNVLVGTETADDAGVYRLTDELALVQTVDYITPVVDDPYTCGAVAAANSLSDIYAMGAKPIFAMNIVGFPSRTLPLAVLAEILRGGATKAQEAGIDIIGGHSIDDTEPKYGLVVSGLVHPGRIVRNVGTQPGDVLILTKPIGVGILTTGIKQDRVTPAARERVTQTMTTLNRAAAEAMEAVGVHACTDITGFGLLGHLHEMTSGSGVEARLSLSAVPTLEETWELVRQGVCPGGTKKNLAAVSPYVTWAPGITEEARLILADAQTSGGLLIALPQAKASKLLKKLQAAHTLAAAQVGEIVGPGDGRIHIVP